MSRFVLPKTAQAKKWVRCTDMLRAHLQERLSTVRGRAEAKRKEANEIEAEGAQLEQAIALLEQLLPPRPAQQPTPISRTQLSNGRRWSPASDACIDCGQSEAPHVAHGRCRACYSRWRYAGRPASAASA